MLPVMESGCAMMWSADDAIQYAPLAPTSRIHATVGFVLFRTADAISADATGVPPGLLI